jgi:hypothetical protein
MLHNYIISSIIPENNTPFRPAVTEELRGNFVVIFPQIYHKTIDLCKSGNQYSSELYHFHPVPPTDLCVKNQSKTPYRLWARGDNKKEIINLIIMQMNYII